MSDVLGSEPSGRGPPFVPRGDGVTEEAGLSYDDLLSLYRGKSSVLEQLSADQRRALAIETPLTAFLRDAAAKGTPRHILLTGNAGDGKSFAAVTAGVEQSFSITVDASAGDPSRASAPVDDLARRLTADLEAGSRLLVAINRGQLERLEMVVRQGPFPALLPLIEAARAQATLRVTWGPPTGDCAPVDLGLLDTADDRIVSAMLAKVCSAAPSDDLHGETRKALTAAQRALAAGPVREYLLGVIRLAQAHGHHPTMRQLWSFFAYLVTGARQAGSDLPASVRDSVGARLFNSEAEGPLFEYARELADPAAIPQPKLTRRALLSELEDGILVKIAELRGLRPLGDAADGEMLTRVAAVHGLPEATRTTFLASSFHEAVALLRRNPPGWAAPTGLADRLLRSIYRVLGLWSRGSNFPAWQTLCYDSSRFHRASALASDEVDPRSLRIGLPRPSPWGEAALGGAWLPPFLWLASVGSSEQQRAGRLRLPPRLFDVLYAAGVEASVSHTDALSLRRWLSLIPTSDRQAASLRLATRNSSAPLLFAEDPLRGEHRLEWEGPA